jgi:hypothetical protein
MLSPLPTKTSGGGRKSHATGPQASANHCYSFVIKHEFW